MNNEDASYLRRRGFLDLPATSLQNDLIESLTEHVYSYIPIVDLHGFLQLLHTHDGRRGQISLLLYQAVLFSASHFVENRSLSGTGFSTREDVQNSFFLRARWLYDLGYESNRLPIVQSLLLMSFRQGLPDTIKDDGWYWLGAAISMAYAVDLHHALSITDKGTLTQGLRKRLWWSCYTHELVMSLTTQRPMRIREEDFDIPMVGELDFNYRPVPRDIAIISRKCKIVRTIRLQQDLAHIFIARSQLSLCLGRLGWVAKSSSTKSTSQSDMISGMDQRLMLWAESLAPACQYRTTSVLDIQIGRSPIVVQRNILHMLHYTAVSLLHRSQFLSSSQSREIITGETKHISRLRVREAVLNITRMTEDLHSFRLDRFLPPAGVTFLLSAISIHVLEMTQENPKSCLCAAERFQKCMEVMKVLGKIYVVVQDAMCHLDSLLRGFSHIPPTLPTSSDILSS